MILRRIKETDLNQLILLYDHLHEGDIKGSKEELEKIWQQILKNDSLVYFVIELNEALICSCNLTIIPNLTRGGKSIGIIENVVTHVDYRNKGLGKIIMETAIDHARNMNCYKIMILSSSKRKESHKFYRSLGFNSEDKIGFVMNLN